LKSGESDYPEEKTQATILDALRARETNVKDNWQGMIL